MQEPQHPQLPEETPLSSEVPTALDNFQGYCFRNTILVMLINEPAFVNWLMRHQMGICLKDKECLICAFKTLALQYHRPSAKSTVVHGSLDVFWDLCEKSFWGFQSKRKVPLGSTASWSGNSHMGFLFHLLDALLENVQHPPFEVQHYQRLFYTEAIKVRACLECGAIDERGTDSWFRRCFEVDKPAVAARKMEDVLYLASSYAVTATSCLHCSGKLLDHMKIINPAELIFLSMPATPLNESEAKIHPLIPMQPELNMQINGPRYFLQAAAISPPRPHIFACVRARNDKLYKIDKGGTWSIKSWQHYERAQQLVTPERRVFPKLLLYTRRGPNNGTLSITPPLKPTTVRKTGPGKSPPKRSPAPQKKDGRSTRTTTGSASVDAATPVREASSNDPAGTNPQASPGLTAEFNNISFVDKDASVHQAKVIKAAFPKLTSEEASQLLAAYNGHLQEAVDALKTHPSQQSMLLDDVPEEHQIEVLTAYLRFPGIPIGEILRVVRRHHPNPEKAYQELTDKPEINLGFTEHIGDSRFATRICITPDTSHMTDSAPPKQQFPARQMIRGHAKLQTGKAIYAGSFEGELELEEVRGTRSYAWEEWQPLPLDPRPLLWNDYYARFKEYRFGETLSEAEKEAQKAREEQATIERQVLDRVRELDSQLDSSLRWDRSRARTQLRREDEQKERAGRDEVLQKMIQAELRRLLTPQPKQDSVLKKDPGSVQGKRRRSAQSDDDDGANDRARIRVLRAKHDGFAVKPLPAEKKRSEDMVRLRAQLLANQVASARKGGSTMQASRVLEKREEKRKWKGRLMRSSDVENVARYHHDVESPGDYDNDGKDDGGWEVVTRRRKGRIAAQSSTASTGRSGDVGKKGMMPFHRDDEARDRKGVQVVLRLMRCICSWQHVDLIAVLKCMLPQVDVLLESLARSHFSISQHKNHARLYILPRSPLCCLIHSFYSVYISSSNLHRQMSTQPHGVPQQLALLLDCSRTLCMANYSR